MTKLHEENFYTYRYDLLDFDWLDATLVPQEVSLTPGAPVFNARSLTTTGTSRLFSRTGGHEGDIPQIQPDRNPPPLPPPPPDEAPEVSKAIKDGAQYWHRALKAWQLACIAINHRQHELARYRLSEAHSATMIYFKFVRGRAISGTDERAQVVSLLSQVGDLDLPAEPLIQHILLPRHWNLSQMLAYRKSYTEIERLHQLDWAQPLTGLPLTNDIVIRPTINANCKQVLAHLAQVGRIDVALLPHIRQKLDYFLLVAVAVFIPLARAEIDRDARLHEAAIDGLSWVLNNSTPVLNEPIEVRFIRLLLAECLIEQGDTEYRAETPVSPPPLVPPPPDRLVRYDWMKARTSYERAIAQLRPLGTYDAQVTAAVAKLEAAIRAPEPELAKLGKEILVETIKPVLRPGESAAAGQERMVRENRAAAAPLLQIGDTTSTDTNPRVFALLLTANARLEQIKADFNWLGYPDDYTPPWRFQFLLERGRYFAEHAKQAQRDYLNFLSNAEREEFQEKSAAQAVQLESANIAIEDARVTHAEEEYDAATLSQDYAEKIATDAQIRVDEYGTFDQIAEKQSDAPWWEQASQIGGAILSGAAGGLQKGGGPMAAAGALGGFLSSVASLKAQERADTIQAAQRDYEKRSLELAKEEAHAAKLVAEQQEKVALAAVTVANLQRQAALLRHELAVETVAYLMNRKLNAEQWFRLASAIRAIAETYLRYAIEIAFLAEQAYEFEADKQMNVIRFDYDLSELGEYLAGDFLLKDLDTLEHDLIVSQRERQQHVRYVLSMAREFPEALQTLRDDRRVTFSMVLGQLEQRFPGLILARLGAVDVLPIALMDQTRFSLRLTHQGFSRMRSRPRPGTDPTQPWPAEARLHAPETAIYSGLTRQDAASIFPVASSGQRNAFEGRGAAGAWEIDMSVEENQVVPGTLADIVITFTMSGYYDGDARTEPPEPGPDVLTSFVSARQTFPDNFYDFNRTGRMVWPISSEFLTMGGRIGRLRNVGITLVPEPGVPRLSGLMSFYRMRFLIEKRSDGSLGLRIQQPTLRLEFATAGNNTLTVIARETGLDGAVKRIWDFGDGSGFKAEPPPSEGPMTHTYSKPGSYKVTMRATHQQRLIEMVSDIAVSRAHGLLWRTLDAPPELRPAPGRWATKLKIAGKLLLLPQGMQGVEATWRLDGQAPLRSSGPEEVSFELKPGSYSLDVRVARSIKANLLCDQRSIPSNAAPFDMNLSLTTNLRFNEKGEEINGTPNQPERNPLTNQLFNSVILSPVDDWAFELPLQYASRQGSTFAPFAGVTSRDEPKYELGYVQDLLLALEYEVE